VIFDRRQRGKVKIIARVGGEGGDGGASEAPLWLTNARTLFDLSIESEKFIESCDL
jgi:hypothetical protein